MKIKTRTYSASAAEPSGRDIHLPSVWHLLTLLLLSYFLLVLAFPMEASPYTIVQNDDQVTGQVVISPTKVELFMDPGDRESREIIVVNRTGAPATFEFVVEDFEGSLDPSQATVFLGNQDSPRGAKNWLTPEIFSVTLAHGETLTMNVDVEVPLDAQPGGHYAAFFASSLQEQTADDGSNIMITSRIGTLFLVTVSGEIEELGTLNEPEVSNFSEYGPIEIGLVFNNLGNVHLKPHGQVTIRNFFGQTVAEVPVQEWIVLPEASRRTLISWESDRPIGRYTATAEINYGEEEGPVLVLSETSFWVIPWRLILIIAAILLVLGIISYLVYRRARQRRRTKQDLEEELADLKAVQAMEAVAPPEPAEPAPPAPAPEPGIPENHVPLNELFPAIDDTRLVDITDPETHKLVRELISGEMDLAQAFQQQGMIDEARSGLQEARSAAERLGLLSEVGMIDDMLDKL